MGHCYDSAGRMICDLCGSPGARTRSDNTDVCAECAASPEIDGGLVTHVGFFFTDWPHGSMYKIERCRLIWVRGNACLRYIEAIGQVQEIRRGIGGDWDAEEAPRIAELWATPDAPAFHVAKARGIPRRAAGEEVRPQ